MNATHVILDILEDFEEFIGKLERRKEELKDELLIYSDSEFMESIGRRLEELERGETVKCENESEMDKLFKSL